MSVAFATPDGSGGATSVWDLRVRQKEVCAKHRIGTLRARETVTREEQQR